ncbi:MAG TPA: hypothetical protein VGN97_21760 [Mesorhizobium sp.]|jgi:hypothetical protein|nr:hypothetical protein [Mesorhizobium sp.]
MRPTLVTPLALLALCAAAHAHDVRLSDGSPFEHDCHSAYFAGTAPRNVSVTVPQVFDCEKATWPDIPASCLAQPPVLTASAG